MRDGNGSGDEEAGAADSVLEIACVGGNLSAASNQAAANVRARILQGFRAVGSAKLNRVLPPAQDPSPATK